MYTTNVFATQGKAEKGTGPPFNEAMRVSSLVTVVVSYPATSFSSSPSTVEQLEMDRNPVYTEGREHEFRDPTLLPKTVDSSILAEISASNHHAVFSLNFTPFQHKEFTQTFFGVEIECTPCCADAPEQALRHAAVTKAEQIYATPLAQPGRPDFETIHMLGFNSA